MGDESGRATDMDPLLVSSGLFLVYLHTNFRLDRERRFLELSHGTDFRPKNVPQDLVILSFVGYLGGI